MGVPTADRWNGSRIDAVGRGAQAAFHGEGNWGVNGMAQVSRGCGVSRVSRLVRVGAFACAVAIALASATPALAQSRASKAWQLRKVAMKAQNSSLRYLHTTWYNANYGGFTYVSLASVVEASCTAGVNGSLRLLRPRSGFTVTSLEEHGTRARILAAGTKTGASTTRQQASVAYATALALANNTYDARRVRVSRDMALKRTVSWMNALALSHARREWGLSWQSALWTYYMGAGSKKVWGSLPDATRELVGRAVAEEADRLLTIPPPYYRDATGTVVTVGDSQAEENGWNAALLFLAARMFQSASPAKAAQWEAQGRWYALTANATPDQVGTDPRIVGSNLNLDGTVTNHYIIHPDYMASTGEMQAKYLMVAQWSNSTVPWEYKNRFQFVWRGLTAQSFHAGPYWKPGGKIYRVRRGAATADIYYPQGADWSKRRKHNFALMDVAVFFSGVDVGRKWAGAHLKALVAQQARHKDGRIFNSGETHFKEEEQFGAVCSAEMVESLRMIR
jgi:hypothetical protein